MTYGTFQVSPDLAWPMKEPAEVLDYSYDGTSDLGSDTITSAALAISPPGELTAAKLTVSGGISTFWLSGGVPGRRYIIAIQAATTAGRTFQWIGGIVCNPLLAAWPLVSPSSSGFGTPITWGTSGGVSFDFSQTPNSQYFGLL